MANTAKTLVVLALVAGAITAGVVLTRKVIK